MASLSTASAVGPDEVSVGYRDLEGVRGRLRAWVQERPDWVEPFALGRNSRGVEAPGLQFGAPGQLPLEERPVLLLIGGLDGVSLAGGEAVLVAVEELLGALDELPPELSLVAIPWASPEGLERALSGRSTSGANGTPVDLDRDGRTDEDPLDDLDGDGELGQMLLERPDGAWALSEDRRFLRRAGPLDAPRYELVGEGRDDDGDGRFNEDDAGGVVLDRNFPVAWEPRAEGAGDWPLSEPLARSLAELALDRRTVAALFFQGAHGRVATPGGAATPLLREGDAGLFEGWSRRAEALLGRADAASVRLFEARREERGGAALDWFYASAGVLGLEVSVWGPQVALEGFVEPALSTTASGDEELWMQWVDDLHGGIGFADWAPVELAGGVRGLVGGFRPQTRMNPPAAELARVTSGAARLVSELAQARPRLETEVRLAQREGTFCRLRIRLRNEGDLPSGLARPDTFGRRGGRLRLELPEDARWIAGDQTPEFDHVPGRGISPEFEWHFTLPEGASVVLEYEDDWCATVREVLAL